MLGIVPSISHYKTKQQKNSLKVHISNNANYMRLWSHKKIPTSRGQMGTTGWDRIKSGSYRLGCKATWDLVHLDLG